MRRIQEGKHRAEMALLVTPGARPDLTRMADLAHSCGFTLTHRSDEEPASGGAGLQMAEVASWCEVLVDGLTFDIRGFCPRRPVEQFAPAATYGDVPPSELEAIAIIPGPHIAAGSADTPILQAMARLTSSLAEELDAVAVSWAPARTLMSRDYFSAVVDAWTRGGAFPALGLTAFHPGAHGGGRSEGLRFFLGLELELAPHALDNAAQSTRLAIRLIDRLVSGPPVPAGEVLVLPSGECVALSLDERRAIIHARIVS